MLFFSQALKWISVWDRHLIWKTFHVSHFSKWLSLGSLCKHGELLINTIKAYQKWNSTFLGNFNILSSILVQKILKSPHVNLKQFLCHNSCACFIWKNYIFFDYVERLTHLKSDKKMYTLNSILIWYQSKIRIKTTSLLSRWNSEIYLYVMFHFRIIVQTVYLYKYEI